MTWQEYLAETRTVNYQKGTRIGKKAVRQFIKGLNIRLNWQKEDMITRTMLATFFLLKWIAEINDFDPEANCRRNVPVTAFYLTNNKRHLRLNANVAAPNKWQTTKTIVDDLTAALKIMKRQEAILARHRRLRRMA